MVTLYAYEFNTENRIMKSAEVEVNETEKQYSMEENGESMPFLYKRKILKSEIGEIHYKWPVIVVYLTERDGLQARQIILDYIRNRLTEHEKKVAGYQACVDSLTGE